MSTSYSARLVALLALFVVLPAHADYEYEPSDQEADRLTSADARTLLDARAAQDKIYEWEGAALRNK